MREYQLLKGLEKNKRRLNMQVNIIHVSEYCLCFMNMSRNENQRMVFSRQE